MGQDLQTLPSGGRTSWRQSLTARLILVNGGLVVGTALVLSALALYLLSLQIAGDIQARLEATRQLAGAILELRVDEQSGLASQMSGDALAMHAVQSGDVA